MPCWSELLRCTKQKAAFGRLFVEVKHLRCRPIAHCRGARKAVVQRPRSRCGKGPRRGEYHRPWNALLGLIGAMLPRRLRCHARDECVLRMRIRTSRDSTAFLLHQQQLHRLPLQSDPEIAPRSHEGACRVCCGSVFDNDAAIHFLVPRTAEVVAQKVIHAGLVRRDAYPGNFAGR